MDLEVVNLRANSDELDKASKSVDALDQKISKVQKTVTRAEESLKILRGELIQVGSKTVSLGDGFTKSQANMLAMLKQAGATTTELKQMAKTMEQLNKIAGSNPFDKSTSALNYIKKQREELTKSIKFAEKYNDLNKEQIALMTRGIESVRQRAASEKKSFGEREAAVRKFINEFTNEAQAYNKITSEIEAKNRASREEVRLNQEKAKTAQIAARERASAERYVQEQMEKTLFMNKQMEAGFSTSGANALYNYKKNLDQVGLSADQAEKQLREFGEALQMKASLQNKRNPVANLREDIKGARQEVNQLARAVSVQMGDVAVSLAGGMNPFLVAIQQGDQIRFALEQARAAGQSLDGVMTGAAKSMINSFMLVGQVIGSFVKDGIMFMGRSLVDLAGAITGAGSLMATFDKQIAAAGGATTSFGKSLTALKTGLATVAGTAAATILVLVGTYLVGLYKVSKQQDELVKALYSTGAALGMSKEQMISFAEEVSGKFGVSTQKSIDAITEFTKKGIKFTDDMVASSIELSQVTGESIDKIVEGYSKLKDKPTEALIEIAKSNGLVSTSIIEQVKNLEDQGRASEAVSKAMEAKAASDKQLANSMYESFSPLTKLFIDIRDNVDLARQAVYDLVQNESLVNGFRTAWEVVALIVSDVWYVIKQTGNEIGGIAAQLAMVLRGDFAGAKAIGDEMKVDAARARSELDAYQKALVDRNNKQKASVEGLSESQRKANADAASWMDRNLKSIEEGLSKEEKYRQAKAKLNLEIEKGNALVKQGILSQGQVDALKAASVKLDEEFQKSLQTPESSVEKYSKRIAEKIRDLSISVTDDWNQMFASSEALTKSQKAMLDIIDDPLFQNMPMQEKELLMLQLARIAAKEQEVISERNRFELYQQTYALEMKMMEQREAYQESYEAAARAIQEETNAIALREQLLGTTEAEAKKVQKQYEANVKIAQIENKYIAERKRLLKEYNDALMEGVDPDAAFEAYNKAMQNASKLQKQEFANVHREVAISAKEDFEKEFIAPIKEGLADALYTALTEGGKAGADKVKQLLQQKLKEAAMKPINIIVNFVVDAGRALLGSAVSGVASWLGLGSGTSSMLGNLIGGVGSAGVVGSLIESLGKSGTPSSVVDVVKSTALKGESFYAGYNLTGVQANAASTAYFQAQGAALAQAQQLVIQAESLIATGVPEMVQAGKDLLTEANTAVKQAEAYGSVAENIQAGNAFASEGIFGTSFKWIVESAFGEALGLAMKEGGKYALTEAGKEFGGYLQNDFVKDVGPYLGSIAKLLQGDVEGAAIEALVTFVVSQVADAAVPYVGAILKLAEGDVAGAAISAAITYIGSLFGPIGWVIAGIVNLLVGMGGGGEKYPAMESSSVGMLNTGNITVGGRIAGPAAGKDAGANSYLDQVNTIFLSRMQILYDMFDVEEKLQSTLYGRIRRTSGDWSTLTKLVFGEGEDKKVLNRFWDYGAKGSPVAGVQAYAKDLMVNVFKQAVKMSALPDIVKQVFADNKTEDEILKNVTALSQLQLAMKLLGTDIQSFTQGIDIKFFAQEGEKLLDTIGRLFVDLLNLNNMFETLNFTLFALTSTGFRQSEVFKELMGGQEEMMKILQEYYNNFFSNEEKRANTIRDIEKQLVMAGADASTLNLEDMTRLQYRELVEATVAAKGVTDPLTIALIKLSSAFASVTEEVPDSISAADELNNKLNQLQQAYDMLVKAIAKERDLAKERLDSVTAIYDISKKGADSLYKNIESIQKMSYNEAKEFISASMGGILQGILPDAEKYQEAVDSLVTGVGNTRYATKADSERARIVLANQLQQIADQLAPEKTALESQLEYLALLESNAREQLEIAKNGEQAILSLVDAINNWTARISGFPAATSVGGAMLSTASSDFITTNTPEIAEYNGDYVSGTIAQSSVSSDGSLLGELRALREEVVMLRAETRAVASNTSKTSKALDRAMPDGRTIQVSVV